MNIVPWVLLFALSANPPPPAFVRVAIVDDSASMAGDRIRTVRNELHEVLRQLPPSSDHPLVLIVFGHAVAAPQLLTNAKQAEDAIDRLHGLSGGTRIAPALLQGVQELHRFSQSRAVIVMLYTDGEDSDREAILRAEEKLDTLFADRSQQGLSQTVFLKRWGGANLELVERIRRRGHAEVLDAGELKIEPVTIEPTVRLVAAHRDPNNRRQLIIDYEPTLRVRSQNTKQQTAAMVRCLNAQAAGETDVRLTSGEASKRCRLTLPIPDAAEKALRLDLQFQFKSLSDAKDKRTFVLPLVATPLITIPIPLPPLQLINHWNARLDKVTVQGWADPLTSTIRVHGTLVVTSKPADSDSLPGDRAMMLQLHLPKYAHLHQGSDRIAIPQPGVLEIPLTFDVPLQAPPKAPRRSQPFDLEIAVASTAKHLACEPARQRVHQGPLDAPPRTLTTITPNVKSLGTPVWVDLVEPLLEIRGELMVDVQGAIPHLGTLTLVAPSAVHQHLLLPSTTLKSGRNVLPITIVTQAAPGKKQRLEFGLVPPASTAAVEFHVPRGFTVAFTAPPAAQIAHSEHGRPLPTVSASIADNQARVDLRLTPTVVGTQRERLRELPPVKIVRSGNRPNAAAAVPAALFQPVHVQLPLATAKESSFFLDVHESVDLQLQPAKPAPALAAGKVRVQVVRQAPFKRLLTYLAWATFPIGALFVLFRMVRRLREPPQL
jgi:hypothetical protein